jgi:hypothetical protein
MAGMSKVIVPVTRSSNCHSEGTEPMTRVSHFVSVDSGESYCDQESPTFLEFTQLSAPMDTKWTPTSGHLNTLLMTPRFMRPLPSSWGRPELFSRSYQEAMTKRRDVGRHRKGVGPRSPYRGPCWDAPGEGLPRIESGEPITIICHRYTD